MSATKTEQPSTTKIEDDELPSDEEVQAGDRIDVDTPADLDIEDPTIDQTNEDEDLGDESG